VLDNPFDNFRTRTTNKWQDDSALQYVNPNQLAEATVSNGTHFYIVSSLPEKSAAQDQHLAAPQRGINFISSMVLETVRHLLHPFAIEPTSFVVYGKSKDFVAAEVNVRVDNTSMPKGFCSTKHQPPIHQTNPNSPQAYTRVEHPSIKGQAIQISEKSDEACGKLVEGTTKEAYGTEIYFTIELLLNTLATSSV
jgi:hypothetical protein